MSAFCLFVSACSEPPTNSAVERPPEPEPLLTLAELLSADDVKQALAVASREDDQQSIMLWQSRLMEAAQQVNLAESERRLLSGEQGRVFLAFQGMKTNYQYEFERAFFEFGDVDAVYARYPAFESLQQQSKNLVAKRDALINRTADTFSKQGVAPDIAIEQAKQQWQTMMFEQQSLHSENLR